MAAAVPQHVREFNVHVSKAQMTQAFLQTWGDSLAALFKAVESASRWPSPAAQQRAIAALQQTQKQWSQRHAATLGSLDECLLWSAVHPARKRFHWGDWTLETLRARQDHDREMLSFCLMGQEGAHGAFLVEQGRSDVGNRYALAAALAPLGIQMHHQPGQPSLMFSVSEQDWPVLQQRFMARGNGQRFPAGQWAAPLLIPDAQAVQPARWRMEPAPFQEELLQQLPALQERVAQALQSVQQFLVNAGNSLLPLEVQHLQQMQEFAQAFRTAGQMPSYDWVLAVVPAVRVISRRRVARLLRSRGALA